jgi:putative intracellular protease/amidase
MQYRITTMLSCALSLLIVAPANAASNANNRVLLVISGYGADGGKTRPGFEMDELTQAYAVFADNGLTVDIASPTGGTVVADEFDRNKPYNNRFLSDAKASAKLTSTRSIASVRDENYAAIFVMGGKGSMFDLPINTDLKTLLAKTYEAGGVIGAVCHGPAVLMNVPMKNGGYLLDGRSVTGFSNEEETLFGKGWLPSFPVLLENGLRGSGAKFSEAPMMLGHVVVDGRLVTGQNPASTIGATEAIIRAMGRTPAPRQPWADERSMTLLSETLNGDKAGARAAFAANPKLYDIPLIAMWGFFRAKSAGTDRAALAHAVEMMELAAPHFTRPQLVTAIAEGRSKLAKMN